MSMRSLLEVFRSVIEALEANGIDYMIVGSIAAVVCGRRSDAGKWSRSISWHQGVLVMPSESCERRASRRYRRRSPTRFALGMTLKCYPQLNGAGKIA
jgi:hypothetical protein